MNKTRRTSEEVTNDMFYERMNKKDLVIIAAEKEGYWCRCKGRCQCGNPKKNFFAKEAYIYRSIGKPTLCFFYKWYCDEDAYPAYTLYRFKYKYLQECLEPDMIYDSSEYDAIVRKKKVRIVLSN